MSKYLDIIPKIRVYERKLFDKSKIDRLVEYESSDDVFKFLSESEYGSDVSGDLNEGNYEKMLSHQLNSLFKNIKEICKSDDIVDIFTMKYVFSNIKFMLKNKFLGTHLNDALFYLDNIDNDKLYDSILNEDFRSLPSYISKSIKDLVKSFEESVDYRKIDFLLDSEMFKVLKEKANMIGDDFIIKYINVITDIFNLKATFRMKKLGLDKKVFDEVIKVSGNIPLSKIGEIFLDSNENIQTRLSNSYIYKYIKNGLDNFVASNDIESLEVELDNYIMEFLKYGKIITSGLPPIIGYINAKESELRNIRFIIVGKLNNIPPEVIKGRLVLNYV